MNIPFFGEITSQHGVSPDPNKIQVLTDMSLLKMRNLNNHHLQCIGSTVVLILKEEGSSDSINAVV